jgi:predicted lysophospholipase L1 biosynthesis ABC-type transport system permease subunit
VLTASGLFSVLSYIVEQRAKEIGVRMALGATTSSIAGLVLSQSFRPIAIGLVAGGGIAAAFTIVLMATPLAAEIPEVVHVFDPVAYAASLLVIVTSCGLAVWVPAVRAARIDPFEKTKTREVIDKISEKKDTPLNNLWDDLKSLPKTPWGAWICSLYLGWPGVQCTGMESASL